MEEPAERGEKKLQKGAIRMQSEALGARRKEKRPGVEKKMHLKASEESRKKWS